MNDYKDKNYQSFKVLRGIGVPIFKTLFHPQINNKEFIKGNEPTIFFGNHRHVFDQFPVICATPKYIRWFAKKEYFDSKLRILYEATGCIEVDRGGDTSKAMDEATECLEQGGSIGIFPEGTRNIYYLSIMARDLALKKLNNLINIYGNNHPQIERAKLTYEQAELQIIKAKQKLEERGYEVIEDDLLLGFKKGAAILSNKTGVSLSPFAVTGDYKITNKNLTVTFGEKILPENKTVETLNEEMRNTVKELVLKNEPKRSNK